MSNNYGEPWIVSYETGYILDRDNEGLGMDIFSFDYTERAVACVNACAGMSNEELAALGTGGVKKLQEALRLYDDEQEERLLFETRR